MHTTLKLHTDSFNSFAHIATWYIVNADCCFMLPAESNFFLFYIN